MAAMWRWRQEEESMESHKFSPVKKSQSQTPPDVCADGEWKEFVAAVRKVPWIKLGVIILVASWFHRAFSVAGETLEEMEYAYKEDLPLHTLPTRSEYESIPVIGKIFRLSCDVGDVTRVNGKFFRDYVTLIPWLAATPALVGTLPLLAAPLFKGVVAGKAAMLALGPVMAGMR